MARSHKHRDKGFSLPEVLISVVLMATISTVMVGVVAVVLRNAPTTSARADDARTLQGIVTWLPQDVDSTPPNGFDTSPTRATGCSVNPGVNLLRMEWSERLDTQTTRFIASYRHVQVGDASRIQRVTCSGTGNLAAADHPARAQNMTAEVAPLPPGWTAGQLPARVTSTVDASNGTRLVVFEIQTLDGKVVRIDAAPKNPAQTLPPLPPPPWLPPAPDDLGELAVRALPGFPVDVRVPEPDSTETLSVRIESELPDDWTSTSDGALLLTLTPDLQASPGTEETISYSVGYFSPAPPPSEPVTTDPDEPPPSDVWTQVATGTVKVTIDPQCTVTGSTVSPSSVRNVNPDGNGLGSGNEVTTGPLRDPVTVTATTNGDCASLIIRYDTGVVESGVVDPNDPGSKPFRNMSRTNATTFTVTLPSKRENSTELWRDGDRTLEFLSTGEGTPLATNTLTVL